MAITNFLQRMIGKAVSSYSGSASSIYPSLPSALKPTDDPTKLMRMARGMVAAANHKVSAGVAALPIHLYANVSAGQVGKLFTPHQSLHPQVLRTLKAARPRIAGAKSEIVEITDHPFLDLMRRPSEGWSTTEWMYTISSYLGLIGNAYLEKQYRGDVLTGLKPLQSEYMAITYDKDGIITKYDFNPSNTMAMRKYEPSEIVHIRNRTAGSLIAGRGNLEQCQEAFNVSNGAYAYTSALLNNMAVPGGMFAITNGEGGPVEIPEGADPDTYIAAMRQKALDQFGGLKRGVPMVTFGKTTWTPTNVSMADTRIDAFLKVAKQEIAAAFSVPVTLLDDSDSNRATAYVAGRNLQKYAVLPKLGLILDQLTSVIQEEYDPDLYCWYNPTEALDSDPVEQADVLSSYVSSNIMSINEARNILGLAPVETTANA